VIVYLGDIGTDPLRGPPIDLVTGRDAVENAFEARFDLGAGWLSRHGVKGLMSARCPSTAARENGPQAARAACGRAQGRARRRSRRLDRY
jgi:hypothetical protein